MNDARMMGIPNLWRLMDSRLAHWTYGASLAVALCASLAAGCATATTTSPTTLKLTPTLSLAVMGASDAWGIGTRDPDRLNWPSQLAADLPQPTHLINLGEPGATLSDARRANYRARRMGFIFQNFNLLPVLSAIENVEIPLLLLRIPAREARRRARAMLAAVGLTDRERHRPAELSGGQRQRVAIARALVNEPAIVWADEPTGNLDSDAASEIMELLGRLNRELEQTLVLVTHTADIGALAHRIMRMRDGRIIEPAV